MITWIKRLLAAPVFADEEKTRASRLLNIILLALLGATIAVIIAIPVLVGLPDDPNSAFTWLAGVITAVVIAGLLGLARQGHIRTASAILLSLLWLIMAAWVCGVSGIASDNSITEFALLIVLGGLLLGGRGAMALTLVSALAIGLAYYLEVSGWTRPKHDAAAIMDLFLTIVPMILIGIMLRYAVDSLVNALRRAQKNEHAQMAANRELQAIRASLEERVADRTRDLARRAAQLQAATEMGRAIASSLEPEQLIHQTVEMARAQFGLRYAGLFLMDEADQWAVLAASAGDIGLEQVVPRYQVQVAEGLIGQCIAQGRALTTAAADAGPPPAAGSALALPLRSRGRTLGALLFHSDQAEAFDPAATAVLETVADQVAVALDNTRLFAESREALKAARRAYGELSREAWAELLRPREDWGYRYAHQFISPLTGHWQPELAQAAQEGQQVVSASAGEPTLALPLKVRDQVVGALGFYKSTPEETWTPEEVTLLETLVDQLGVALESARLYQDTQRRAARERLTGEITARMRETLDLESVLITAAQEMRQALGLPEVLIRLANRPVDVSSGGPPG